MKIKQHHIWICLTSFYLFVEALVNLVDFIGEYLELFRNTPELLVMYSLLFASSILC